MPEKYDRIGQGYNQTRKADPYLLSRMHFYLNIHPNAQILDIGCGTGNYTMKLAAAGGHFTGVEPSEKMLKVARTYLPKGMERAPNIQWLQGKAEQLPIANQSIDAVIASLTLHHWTSLENGFQEIKRVLKIDGHFVVFTSTSEQMEAYWLKHYFPKMLQDSIDQMPSKIEIENALQKAGLQIVIQEKYFIHDELEDQFLYCGKNNPQLYLKPTVRNGISSFSDLANQKEVEQGLHQLEKDINSGKISTIIQQYQNDGGDYLFIKALAN